jgi:hypothetical protein
VNEKTTMTCAKCKQEVVFHGWQFSKKCDHCGNLIILTKVFRGAHTQRAPDHKCRYCRDTGWIVAEKQVNGQLCEYAYRCLCGAGQDRPEIGIPFAVDVDMSLVK